MGPPDRVWVAAGCSMTDEMPLCFPIVILARPSTDADRRASGFGWLQVGACDAGCERAGGAKGSLCAG